MVVAGKRIETGCRVCNSVDVLKERSIPIRGVEFASGIAVESLETCRRVETSVSVAKKRSGSNGCVVAACGKTKKCRIAFSGVSIWVGAIRRRGHSARSGQKQQARER